MQNYTVNLTGKLALHRKMQNVTQINKKSSCRWDIADRTGCQ